MKRLFKKSDYEKTFKKQKVLRYKGIDIYWYISLDDMIRLTFWYGSEESEYVSSSSSNILDIKNLIDDILKEKIYV